MKEREQGAMGVHLFLLLHARVDQSPVPMSYLLLSHRRQHYYYYCPSAFYNTFNNREDDHDNRTDTDVSKILQYKNNKYNLMNIFGSFFCLLSIH